MSARRPQGEEIAVLSVQMAEVIKDVEGLRRELADHRGEHRDAERARVSGRRWLAGLAVALAASVDGPVLAILFSRR